MLREFLTYVLCDAASGARKAGLVRECVAIAARYRRHSDSWSEHLERCKYHVSEALQRCDPSKPVLVLGVGPCLDIPVEALATHPAGATLVDAVLLPQTKKWLACYPGLKFKLQDLTGLLAASGDVNVIPEIAPIDTKDYGLIISANIVSQLPLAFANIPPENDNDRAIIKAIQGAHITALKQSGVPALVLSDFKADVSMHDGKSGYNTLDSSIFAGDAVDKWLWAIAPLGELGADRELSLSVGAWQLNWEFENA